ncbi:MULTISPECIES: MFS transporter [Streptosporangium]|uniref:EmrB/QacA subfamily drug resistance transporter n=1 Tax=Streptosporangium brasiliense TaxID=47480 RepID=A0ABT9RAU7_9ACTN|nr:MFS transporter [Streptosporangium brasiliense]MDP9866379.1 EmrB/QacA subfamily drug resistance transporter [Streptosporangium brasiliense]
MDEDLRSRGPAQDLDGAADPDGTAAAPDPRRWRALAVLALVQFMFTVDSSIVNIALPSVQRDLGASTEGLAWVVNAYVVTAGGLLLLGGRLADLWGRRRVFLAGTAVFALASLASGVAGSTGMLVAGRFGQGLGEALAAPAALSMIVLMFPDGRERARALAIWGGLSGLGATAGVLLSGALTELAGWRWVFFVNLPVAAVALLLAPRLVDARPGAGGRRVDWAGAVLVTGGLIALISGLLAAGRNGWGAPVVLLPLGAGLAALAASAVVETRSAAPLVPPRFLASRVRLSANLATITLTSGMAATMFLLTLYMQNVLGYQPLATGLAYLPFCVAFLAGLAASTALTAKLGTTGTIGAGLVLSAAGMLYVAVRMSVTSGYAADVLPAMVMIAAGLGTAFPALQNAALHGVTDDDAGLGSGVQTTMQQLGSALGLAVFTAVAIGRTGTALEAGQSSPAAAVSGYQWAFYAAAGVLLLAALLVSVTVRPARDAGARTRAAEPS